MTRTRALRARVARLEAATGRGDGQWLLTVPVALLRDPAALREATQRHRQTTGWDGPVVITVPKAVSLEAWTLAYGPAAGCD